jgi:uncharacterized protein YndB with AHSA1/START domain
MSELSVIHDTFTIERTYPVAPARVFAAFASREAKDAWSGAGDPEPGGDEGGDGGDGGDRDGGRDGDGAREFDFRVGGRERFGGTWNGTTYRYDALYYDIVPDQRIVYSYEMYADGARISVSVTTIEFAKSGEGTALTFTEQGAFLDGFDGAEAPSLRKEGTVGMIDGLSDYLTAPAAG